MSARYTGGLVYNAPGGWSGYFDGAGDYLSVASNAANALGSGDFTIQFWFNLSGTTGIGSSGEIGFIGCGIVTASRYTVRLQGTSTRVLSWWLNTPSNNVTGTTPIALNTWYHIAWVRSGSGSNNVKLYLNGVLESQGTSTYNSPADTILIGRTYTNLDGEYTNGYLSNMQIVVGTALYTGNFTPPVGALAPVTNTALLTCRYPTFVDGSTNNFTITVNGSTTTSTVNPFPTSQLPNPALGGAGNGVYTMSQYAALKAANLWPAYDPYYKNVTLNLHGNAGAVLPFNTDASTNNFQVTQVGDTRPSNYTPFITDGYWSNYFGANNALRNTNNNTALQMSTGDFTLEMWIFSGSISADQGIFDTRNTGAGAAGLFLRRNNSGDTISYVVNGSVVVSTGAITQNTWQHLALVRQSGTARIYLNGVQAASASSTTDLTLGYLTVGAFNDYLAGAFNGYMSNVRLVKGTCLYPSGTTFTPPTTPLTAITGTTLLTCQSNRFVDNSASPLTLTLSGSPSVNPYQPFTAPTGTSAYGSGYFDGSGDYLSVADNTALEFGSGDFTVEMWAYYSSTSGTPVLIDKRANTGGYSPFIFYTTGGVVVFYSSSNGSSYDIANGVTIGTIIPNQWNHVAASRSGTSIRLFLNGVLGNTVTSSSALVNNSDAWTLGATPGGNSFNGYLSNARLVKGTAVYTSAFTPPTTPLTAITNTSLLTVQTNAPSQNNTFLDSSTNNFPITRNGNTTQGTFTPYGSNWSNYFDGDGDNLTAADNAAFEFGSGAFSIDLYFNVLSLKGYQGILGKAGGSDQNGWILYFETNSIIYFNVGNGSWLLGGALNSVSAPTVNTWTHLCVTKDTSNVYRLFVNGVLTTNTSNATSINDTAGSLYVGKWPYFPSYSSTKDFGGYMTNVRIVKGGIPTLFNTSSTTNGTAVFTPPTAPYTGSEALTAGSVSLLTCQSNSFVDKSSNAFAMTANGTPSVQRFSPFSPTTAYSTSVIGGSGYFDGSGDSMTVGTAANCGSGGAFAMGANFTVEFWYYPLSTAEQTLIENFTGTGGPGWTIYRQSGGQIAIYNGTSGFAGSVVLTTGTWYHIAFVRTSSTSAKTYINGVADMSTSSFGSGEYYQSTYPLYVGQRNPGDGRNFYTTGYFSDVRVTKSAVYSGNFTPPTAPQSPVANTSLLLNFTNAGILDNAMMNDLETVGNAQISTSVKKYGTGSMYFDGTGDKLFAPYTPINQFGAGNFTVEYWIYFNSVATGQRTVSGDNDTSGSINWCFITSGSGVLSYYMSFDGTNWNIAAALVGNVSVGQWYHVALVRNGTSIVAYLNGVAGSTNTSSSAIYPTTTGITVGAINSGNYFNGYIDDLRITKGVARYTANFTPPTSQVQDQ